jgi:hypothetical protein
MTFEAWNKLANDGVYANINREIATMNEKKKQRQSQEDTVQAITAGQGAAGIDQSTVQQLVAKKFEAYAKKFESQMRLKSSVDPKSHGSSTGKNGQSSNRKQGKSQKSSSQSTNSRKQQQKKKQQQQQQPNQKKKQQQQKKSKSNKRKAGSGNQGGANSGKRRKRSRSS